MKNLGKIVVEVPCHDATPEGKVVMSINCFGMMDRVCGQAAFYTTRRLVKDVDVLQAEDVILVDGSRPIDGVTEIRCGSCGRVIDDMDDLFYRE